jgi:phosphate transport system substrate-binding protein
VKLSRSTRLAAALAAGSLALAACGGSDDTTDPAGGDEAAAETALSGTLSGAGASSQESAMQGWIAGFQTANEEVTVNYDPVGSGGGREQFLAGGTDFAGSDAALDEEELTLAEERCGEGGIVEVPLYISPIAVAFNLPGVETLNLSPDVIAGIFKQEITQWNAPEIAADNADADLPDLPITPVNRADESGTTENFTEYLAAAAPEVWTEEPSGEWPIAGGEAGQGRPASSRRSRALRERSATPTPARSVTWARSPSASARSSSSTRPRLLLQSSRARRAPRAAPRAAWPSRSPATRPSRVSTRSCW